jgi:hypothetical protein
MFSTGRTDVAVTSLAFSQVAPDSNPGCNSYSYRDVSSSPGLSLGWFAKAIIAGVTQSSKTFSTYKKISFKRADFDGFLVPPSTLVGFPLWPSEVNRILTSAVVTQQNNRHYNN